MNDRIKELIDECWVTREHCTTWFDHEKFAELIVRECIEQIQLTTARDPRTSAQYKQSVGHIHRIRNHFGIK